MLIMRHIFEASVGGPTTIRSAQPNFTHRFERYPHGHRCYRGLAFGDLVFRDQTGCALLERRGFIGAHEENLRAPPGHLAGTCRRTGAPAGFAGLASRKLPDINYRPMTAPSSAFGSGPRPQHGFHRRSFRPQTQRRRRRDRRRARRHRRPPRARVPRRATAGSGVECDRLHRLLSRPPSAEPGPRDRARPLRESG